MDEQWNGWYVSVIQSHLTYLDQTIFIYLTEIIIANLVLDWTGRAAH